jgi:predicted DNA-binding transcriptional regulator YafY
MNRTDRLLAIVLELQARGLQRAEDLASTFETSKRTIYRDIQALSEAGVPLVSVPGQGYSLVEGYFLPPLTFSADEATMLLLGSDFVAQNFDAQYRAAAKSAGRKIEAVLPQAQRDEVHYLRSNIRFVAGHAMRNPSQQDMMAQLRRAILGYHRVRIRYYARSSPDEANANGAATVRIVDPYALVHISGAWYLIGHCHLRRDVRNFRLNRIEHLELLNETFTRPPGFKVDSRERDEQRTVVIRALFDDQAARWAQESNFFFVVSEEITQDGLLMTLTVRQEEEALSWLLSWGGHVRVLEPETLRKRIADEAQVIARNHLA